MPNVLTHNQICEAWWFGQGFYLQKLEFRKAKTGKTFDVMGFDYVGLKEGSSLAYIQVTSPPNVSLRRRKLEAMPIVAELLRPRSVLAFVMGCELVLVDGNELYAFGVQQAMFDLLGQVAQGQQHGYWHRRRRMASPRRCL